MRPDWPTPPQVELLDALERAILGIRYPTDIHEFFHRQVLLAIEMAGYRCVSEVPLSDGRRVDLLVLSDVGAVAIELDRFRPRRETTGKFADIGLNGLGVLRMLVLRRRIAGSHVYPNVERLVRVESHLRVVPWTVDGLAILEDHTLPDVMRRLVIDRTPGKTDVIPTVVERRPSNGTAGGTQMRRHGPMSRGSLLAEGRAVLQARRRR